MMKTKKRAFLIGGHQKAQALAESLTKKGFQITIINEDYASCLELTELVGVNVICGDGSRPYILDDANIQDADLAIALTRRDEYNLLISELCNKSFHDKNTAALVNDPQKVDFFYQMGVDSVVCSVTSVTSIIEQQMFMDEISSVIPIKEGDISISQVPIAANAPAVGKRLWELNLPEEVIIGCILRGNRNITPHGDTQLLAGDMLILISSSQQKIATIRELVGR